MNQNDIIKLPVKVGQTLYCINFETDDLGYFTGNKLIEEVYVRKISCSCEVVDGDFDIEIYLSHSVYTYSGYMRDNFDSSCIGNKLFYTKEDAENYLKNSVKE